MMKYVFLVGTLGFTAFGQLAIKVGADKVRLGAGGNVSYLFQMLTEPWVILGIAAAGLAALCWLMAVKDLPITFAYPFMAMSFVVVPVGATLFLGERLPPLQLVALFVIVVGVVLSAVTKN